MAEHPIYTDLSQDNLYNHAISAFGAEIARFANGYERDYARRQELMQEMHVALWQSFGGFREQCSLRTWVYRVTHNIGVTHIQRSLRSVPVVELETDDIALVIDEHASMDLTERRLDLGRLLELIQRLAPLDREVMLLYLEDLDAFSIGEIIGLSSRNVATKIHRIKALLANQFGSRSSKT